MALAWNAGWVNALRGSNPLSSARNPRNSSSCGGFLIRCSCRWLRRRSPAAASERAVPNPRPGRTSFSQGTEAVGIRFRLRAAPSVDPHECAITTLRQLQWSIHAANGKRQTANGKRQTSNRPTGKQQTPEPQRADPPPSMVYDAPVTIPASEDASHPTREATSEGSTSRLIALSVSMTCSST